jgi:hypothetical protein
MMRAMRSLLVVALGVSVLAACSSSRAQPGMSEDAVERQNALGLAAVRLGGALQHVDRAELDAAARDTAAALRGFVAYFDAHPKERTPQSARVATAADKLVKTVDALLD